MDKYSLAEISIVPVDPSGKLADMEDKNLDFYRSALVYLLNDKKSVYVGETVSILDRLASHNQDSTKKALLNRHAIHSSYFNKSVTLHLESFLINHFSAEKSLKLLNANLGNGSHYYHYKKEYESLFASIWRKLQELKIARTSFEEIINSNIFKYSPYKSLNPNQQQAVLAILESLVSDQRGAFVQGTAGTGKTIIAIYLVKLLTTPISHFELYEMEDEFSKQAYALLLQYREKNGITEANEAKIKDQIAIVVAMTSLRGTLQTVFSAVHGLEKSMVISPTELTKRNYKIVLVDEAHRLRQRKNLSGYGDFDKSNQRMGLEKQTGTELDWVIKQSNKQVFFYDHNQSIRLTDIPSNRFTKLKDSGIYAYIQLATQVRSKGGDEFTDFVHRLLECELAEGERFETDAFELELYDSFVDMRKQIFHREEEGRLARLVAGFSWEYKTKATKNRHLIDMTIEGVDLRWNSKAVDWINSKNAINEVGSIHTVFGNDLNYIGIIFGHEIDYDPDEGKIVVNRDRYKDKNGKNSTSDTELLFYVKNIYKSFMMRAVKGVYIYVCNPALRDYLSQHMNVVGRPEGKPSTVDIVDLPSEHTIPFYDLEIAAGTFSELQQAGDVQYIKLNGETLDPSRYFACKIIGESMNEIIPNGSICLFERYEGGSRNNQICLVESSSFIDRDFGANYTIKAYRSEKTVSEEGWQHQEITLQPKSTDLSYKPIVLRAEELLDFKVIGVFKRVL